MSTFFAKLISKVRFSRMNQKYRSTYLTSKGARSTSYNYILENTLQLRCHFQGKPPANMDTRPITIRYPK